MATYTGQRERDLAVRVRRMLIEQSAIMAEDSPDELTWLTRHYETEQRFFEEELGARLELRMGRWARAYWTAPPRNRDLLIADIFELTARKQTAYACLIRAYRSVRLLESGDSASVFRFSELFRYVADDRQRPEERYRLDEHDFSGVYEFTDLIDRFLPPAGLVAYDDLRGEED